MAQTAKTKFTILGAVLTIVILGLTGWTLQKKQFQMNWSSGLAHRLQNRYKLQQKKPEKKDFILSLLNSLTGTRPILR